MRCFELTAPESIIEERLVSADRGRKRKLVDLERYRAQRNAGAFLKPAIQHNRMVIDALLHPSIATAEKIAAALTE